MSKPDREKSQPCTGQPQGQPALVRALQECEARYWMTFEKCGAAMAIIEQDYSISLSNSEFQRLTGYSAQEIHDKLKWTALVAPDDLERMCGYHRARREQNTSVPTQYEFRLKQKDGQVRDVFLNVNMVPGTTKSIAAIIDITEHKRAKQALLETEERYEYITEAISDYVYTVYVDEGQARETIHGPASKAITGYTHEELTTDPDLWIRMVPAEDRPAIIAHAQQIISGRDVTPLEHRIIRKDGQIRWVRNTSVRHYAQDGQLKSYDGLVRDITEQKLAEQALRSSEEKHRVVVENASEGICVAQDGMLRLVNSALVSIGGYTIEEILNRPFIEMIHPADRQMVAERHVQRLKGKDFDQVYAFRLIAKNGATRWVEINAVRIDWEGKPATLNFLTDIQDRRLTEEALEESRRQMTTLMSSLPGMAYRRSNDRKRTMDFASEGSLQLTGYRPADLEGDRVISYSDLIHPEDRKSVEQEIRAALAEDRHFQLIYRIHTARGERRWVWEKGRGCPHARGRSCGTGGIRH